MFRPPWRPEVGRRVPATPFGVACEKVPAKPTRRRGDALPTYKAIPYQESAAHGAERDHRLGIHARLRIDLASSGIVSVPTAPRP